MFIIMINNSLINWYLAGPLSHKHCDGSLRWRDELADCRDIQMGERYIWRDGWVAAFSLPYIRKMERYMQRWWIDGQINECRCDTASLFIRFSFFSASSVILTSHFSSHSFTFLFCHSVYLKCLCWNRPLCLTLPHFEPREPLWSDGTRHSENLLPTKQPKTSVQIGKRCAFEALLNWVFMPMLLNDLTSSI